MFWGFDIWTFKMIFFFLKTRHKILWSTGLENILCVISLWNKSSHGVKIKIILKSFPTQPIPWFSALGCAPAVPALGIETAGAWVEMILSAEYQNANGSQLMGREPGQGISRWEEGVAVALGGSSCPIPVWDTGQGHLWGSGVPAHSLSLLGHPSSVPAQVQLYWGTPWGAAECLSRTLGQQECGYLLDMSNEPSLVAHPVHQMSLFWKTSEAERLAVSTRRSPFATKRVRGRKEGKKEGRALMLSHNRFI